jgi:hypothetical protein
MSCHTLQFRGLKAAAFYRARGDGSIFASILQLSPDFLFAAANRFRMFACHVLSGKKLSAGFRARNSPRFQSIFTLAGFAAKGIFVAFHVVIFR